MNKNLFENTQEWEQFLELIHHAHRNKKLLVDILELIFTPEEKEQIASRLVLVKELLKGEKTQREISKEFSISIAKITRGSNNLKKISEGLKKYLVKELL